MGNHLGEAKSHLLCVNQRLLGWNQMLRAQTSMTFKMEGPMSEPKVRRMGVSSFTLVPRGSSATYRVLTVMTQVIAPNEECNQLPVFLQVDCLRG